MATHNQVNLIGYISDEPDIMNEGTEEEQVVITLKSVRREKDGLHSDVFQNILIYYDQPDVELDHEPTEKEKMEKALSRETPMIERLKALHKYDLVEIKGVFMMLSVDKWSECPDCAEDNVREHGSYPVVYPKYLMKLQDYTEVAKHNISLPDALLKRKFDEFSNNITMIGTVVSPPEHINYHGVNCCRYKMVINRKLFVPTQSEIHEDYPYVYSYGKQAERDLKYLQPGAEIFIEGFLRVRTVKSDIQCKHCELTYAYDDVAAEFVPYSVEYLNGHLTDADIERIEKEKVAEALAELRQ